MQTSGTAEAISGRATGVVFFAGFGSLWLFNGLTAMHRMNSIGVAALFLMAAALIVPAAMLLRSTAGGKSAQAGLEESDVARALEVKRGFRRVNLYQWTSIVASIVFFNLLQRPEYLAPVITFLVGIHLIPLARLFRYRPHYATGTLLMLWATFLACALPGEAMPSVGSIGTAVILLGSAIYTLATAGRAARSQGVSGKLFPAQV
jgi:hypothetical protein